jgi:Cft2 family RNA processing exonuclease
MYLFEGTFGRILHTGDFRWELEHQKHHLLHPLLTSAAIDVLYLDNTYANPRSVFDFVSACQNSVLSACLLPTFYKPSGLRVDWPQI